MLVTKGQILYDSNDMVPRIAGVPRIVISAAQL